ncbi:MAG: hypothetical protein R3B57_14865 [Phycisphaerales bacterium]
MGELSEVIWANAVRTCEIGKALARDIPIENFARLPMGEGGPIFMNHPAFVYGHLSLYPARVLKMAGLNPQLAAVPYWYEEVFGSGTICRDDPFAEIYPDKNEIMGQFDRSLGVTADLVRQLPDEIMEETHTMSPEFGSMLLSLGAAAEYLLNNHPMFHLGQVSAWRRCMGLEAAQW